MSCKVTAKLRRRLRDRLSTYLLSAVALLLCSGDCRLCWSTGLQGCFMGRYAMLARGWWLLLGRLVMSPRIADR
jgi:hypothetical protein